ncbi:hypothetical protein TL16_g11920 [Triparma laevis f. inornata]|uniref:Uncharacterized protein n=1 Tax=Triparma laevis f. inornata TaxID=1714386 RepID=A0A9W7BGZ4_9STRA|nr:hypothetical protein TL16_g11920 [Triparma laevis f. inornata]
MQLTLERDAKYRADIEAAKAGTEAARNKFSSVIDVLKQEKEALKDKLKKPGATAATPAYDLRLLDHNKPNVTKLNDNVVGKNIATTNCSFDTRIHEPPEEVLNAFFGDFTNDNNKMLYQKVIDGESGEESVVLFWSFMVEGTKSCELALCLNQVEGGEGEGEI